MSVELTRIAADILIAKMNNADKEFSLDQIDQELKTIGKTVDETCNPEKIASNNKA